MWCSIRQPVAVPAAGPAAATRRVRVRLSGYGGRGVGGITTAVGTRLEFIPRTDRPDESFVMTFSLMHARGVPVVREVVPVTTVGVKTVATLGYVAMSPM